MTCAAALIARVNGTRKAHVEIPKQGGVTVGKIDEHEREVAAKIEEAKKDLYRLMVELEMSTIRSDYPIEECIMSIKSLCNRLLESF
jgi:hypothetical protein